MLRLIKVIFSCVQQTQKSFVYSIFTIYWRHLLNKKKVMYFGTKFCSWPPNAYFFVNYALPYKEPLKQTIAKVFYILETEEFN